MRKSQGSCKNRTKPNDFVVYSPFCALANVVEFSQCFACFRKLSIRKRVSPRSLFRLSQRRRVSAWHQRLYRARDARQGVGHPGPIRPQTAFIPTWPVRRDTKSVSIARTPLGETRSSRLSTARFTGRIEFQDMRNAWAYSPESISRICWILAFSSSVLVSSSVLRLSHPALLLTSR